MRINMVLILMLILLVPVAATAGEQAVKVESIRVVKTSPIDEKAVIKVHGKLQVVKVGDQLSAVSPQLKVIEIAKDRVVLEETGENGPEMVIIRIAEGKQKVERMRKAADRQPMLYAPNVK